jgi:peptide/nickel transport system substrate-binding protein
MDDGREPALREAMRAALKKLPIIPLYNQVTIVAGTRNVIYTPRMDEQLVAYHARPATEADK